MKKSTLIWIIGISIMVLIYLNYQSKKTYYGLEQEEYASMLASELGVGAGTGYLAKKEEEEMAKKEDDDFFGQITGSKPFLVAILILFFYLVGGDTIIRVITRNPIILVLGALFFIVIKWSK